MRWQHIDSNDTLFNLNWGDIPTWILAILGLFSFLSALGAGSIAYKGSQYSKAVLNIELARDANREKEIQKNQATKISAWVEIGQLLIPIGASTFSLVAVINNGSDLPIYNVTWAWSVKDINSSDFYNMQNDGIGLIPPLKPYMVDLDQEKFIENLHLEPGERPNVENALSVVKRSRVAIIFTDAENRTWIRRADGILILQQTEES